MNLVIAYLEYLLVLSYFSSFVLTVEVKCVKIDRVKNKIDWNQKQDILVIKRNGRTPKETTETLEIYYQVIKDLQDLKGIKHQVYYEVVKKEDKIHDEIIQQYEINLSGCEPIKTYEKDSPCTLVFTIGGDGTVLRAALLFIGKQMPPILAYNNGTLGFLAPFDKNWKTMVTAEHPSKNFGQIVTRHRLIFYIIDKKKTNGGNASNMASKISKENHAPNETAGTPIAPSSDENSNVIIGLPTDNNTLQANKEVNNISKTFDNTEQNSQIDSTIPTGQPGTITQSTDFTPIAAQGLTAEGDEPKLLINSPHLVMNDIVIDKAPKESAQLELSVVSGEWTTIVADALIISTPTGSTAYSLSTGASLVHPAVEGFIITLSCPHTLTFRSILLPPDAIIQIKIKECENLSPEAKMTVSYDDKLHASTIMVGDVLEVTMAKENHSIDTISAEGMQEDWINALNKKFSWGGRYWEHPLSSQYPYSQNAPIV